MVVSDIYIYFLFIRNLTENTILRLLWFVPTVLLIGGLYLFFFSGKDIGGRDIFLVTYAAIAIAKTLFTIITLLDLPFRLFFKWQIYPFTIVGLLVALGVFYIAIYGRIWGATDFDVKKVTFESSDIPESFDGYKIVQISDLHIGSWKGNKEPIQKVVDIINRQNADVVFFTGDLVNSMSSELNGYQDILSSIKSSDGVYSVLGNHDYGLYHHWDSEEDQRKNIENLIGLQASYGWVLLNNDHAFLKRNNDSIALIGVENAGEKHFPDFSDLPKAMNGTENTPFKILLSHDPSHWRREVLNTDIDLMLAGHTHGTQFAIGPFSFAQFVYPEWGGLYVKNGQFLYVNVGIGFVAIPFRFGAWPEITVITLKRK